MQHYGEGEAFFPILEGIGRLCRQPGEERLITLLREYAPSWLLQLPGLISADERAALRHEYEGMARYRMLRELIVGLETLTEDTPMILVLMEFRRANLTAARSHLEEAVTLYDPGRSSESIRYIPKSAVWAIWA